MSNTSHNIRVAVSFLISILLLLAAGWVIFNREYVVDQINVWQYEPSADVASISESAHFSDKGEFYFYASNPTIDAASEFNQHCERQETQTAILGCYANRQIYIFNVDNPQLDGIREVTAAHEMLHAVWERMSLDDQKRIGNLLEEQYEKLNNPALDERMDYYERNQPGERANELHSILATEHTDLGIELEKHFSQFFSDRSKVVELHARYQTVFDSLTNQADELYVQIQAQETELTAKIAAYDTERVAVENEYAALQARRNSVDRTSEAEVNEYNSDLASLIVRADALESSRSALLDLQAAYNANVEKYNQLIGVSKKLLNSIDSSVAPAPSL